MKKPTTPVINQEIPIERVITSRYLVTGQIYAGVAVFQLQAHSKYFFDLINGLGFPFPRLCFINNPKTLSP